MARHAENCSGEVEDAENGAPTPKKGRRGRKRKMRSRRDEDDSGETLTYLSVGMMLCSVGISSSGIRLCLIIQRMITLNLTKTRRLRGRGRKKHHCYRKRRRQKAWNWIRPLPPSQYRLLMSHRSRGNEADPQKMPPSLQHPASQLGWLPR